MKGKPVWKKLLIGLGCVALACVIGVVILTVWTMNRQPTISWDTPADTPADTPVQPPALDFEVVDSDEPLVIDTYTLWEMGNHKTLSIYDSAYLGMFFDYDSVTAEETKQVVRENKAITPRFRELLLWYIDAIAAKYPEADLRILHYNLQTLEVVEVDASELAFQSVSLISYGCYKRAENKIYVNKDYEYKPGTWEYQVIIHEFGHAARTIQREIDGDTIYVQLSEDYLEIPEEALNSLFTVSLFDYEERDIAYQLPSNLFQVIVECAEDYSLGDYINHSLTYLAHKLDEQTGHNNYAMAIFRLIDAQRADYLDDSYEREQEVYYPIYDYVCALYLDRYGTADMDEAAREALAEKLVERITYDVPEDHPLDTEEFFRFARDYDIRR